MGNDEYDNFSDEMQRDHAGFDSLNDVLNPTTTLGRNGACVNIRYSCPDCGHQKSMDVGWPEIYCVAAGLNPMECGIQHVWQADAHPPMTTAFGPAMACSKCPRQEAPFIISFREAQGYLHKWPIFQRDPQIPLTQKNVQALLRAKAAAAAHPGFRPG